MFCLSTACFLCTFHRLKSRPFKVMPGLQMTQNPPLRLTVKSTQPLTSSSPLEGSRLFWVTLKYQVRQNHRYLCSIFIMWFSGIQKNLLAGDFRGKFGYYQWWFFRTGISSKVRLESLIIHSCLKLDFIMKSFFFLSSDAVLWLARVILQWRWRASFPLSDLKLPSLFVRQA